MSHFENTAVEFPAMGGQTSKEELAEMRREREQKDAEKEAFLAEEKKRKDKELSIEADRSVLRHEKIDEQLIVEAFMAVNPSFSQYDAERLYSEKLREIVAIRRFELSFFGQPSSAKGLLGVSKM